MTDHGHVDKALKILVSLGFPRAQQNERSALCLLALLNLRPDKKWVKAESPLMGITPIMDWIREHYKKTYCTKYARNGAAPNHAPICQCRNRRL